MLNKYQKALLTSIGIVPLASKDRSAQQQQNSEQQTSKLVYTEQPKTKATRSEPADQLANLKKAMSTTSKQDLQGKVLITGIKVEENKQLLTDVLIALEQDTAPIHVTEQSIERFTGQVFTWKIADAISLANKCLTTPGLKDLAKPECKKQLWAYICGNSDSV